MLISCTKEYKIESETKYCLWGTLVNDIVPEFELADNKNKSTLISNSAYELYMEDITDQSSNPIKVFSSNGKCPIIIKPLHTYTINWRLKTNNEYHRLVKTMPPALDSSLFISVFRNTDRIFCNLSNSLNLTNYKIGFSHVTSVRPTHFDFLPLANSDKTLTLWPPNITNYYNTYLCNKFVSLYNGREKSSSLYITSNEDNILTTSLGQSSANNDNPFWVGEKLPLTYEKDNMLACITAFSFDKKKYIDYIPKINTQTLTFYDNNAILDSSQYKVVYAKVSADVNRFEVPINTSRIKTFQNIFMFCTDDFIKYGSKEDGCNYDEYKPFNFTISAKILNKATNMEKTYTYPNLKYIGEPKEHVLQLY